MDDLETFIVESVAHARSLPVARCHRHLRGLIRLCPDSPLVDQVRGLVGDLRETDAQLELIASGQLRLALVPDAAADRSPEGAD